MPDLSVAGISQHEFKARLTRAKPDIIGITCMFTEFNATIDTAVLFKEANPNVPVIVGGPLPTSVPKAFLEHPTVDIVVIGEGENTMVELAGRLEGNPCPEGVAGTAYKENGKTVFNPPRPAIADIDTLPFPARHLLEMDKYFSSFETWFGRGSRVRATNMISAGLPYSCIFL